MPDKPTQQRTRVVLVDDNADVRRLLREQLDLEGFAVVGEAADGDEAIRVAERLRPHIVILDLEMGRMSGASALPGIRRAAPTCAVVVFSWFPDPFTLASVLALGADLYVDKAEGPAQLAAHLRSLLTEGPGPPDHPVAERLAAVRAELDVLQATCRARRLLPAEHRRYAHLALIEARLLPWQPDDEPSSSDRSPAREM
jgi:DNA-binding NarL/FixJ family response regulator